MLISNKEHLKCFPFWLNFFILWPKLNINWRALKIDFFFANMKPNMNFGAQFSLKYVSKVKAKLQLSVSPDY